MYEKIIRVENMSWSGNTESHFYFQALLFYVTKRWIKDAIFKLLEPKKNDPIMVTTNLFEKLSIYPFEDGQESPLLNLGSCFDADRVLSISSTSKLF